MCKEMIKFRQLLDANNIPWVDASTKFDSEEEEKMLSWCKIDRTHFNYRKYQWSVIHGRGSYGEKEGLLELMSNGVNRGEPIGWLTAEETFELVKGEDDGNR